MSTEKFQALADRGTVLTTELNTLADNANSALGPEYDNSTNRDRYGVGLLTLAGLSGTPVDGSVIELFSIPALDGTTYVDGGGAVDPSSFTYLGTFILRPVGTAQVVMTQRFELLPCKQKFMIRNSTGYAFAGSGNTAKLFTTNRDIA